jgi:hypothetical protein
VKTHAAGRRGRPARAAVWVSLATTTAFCAYVGYLQMFRGLTAYDDEGYVLMSLKGYLAHAHLYGTLYSQYGPFYFQFFGTVFRLLGAAPSHDAGRLITWVIWVVVSLLVGVSLARLTRLWALGLMGQLIAFRHLADLRFEPLHPGGLTSLLLAVVVALLVFGLSARPSPTLFAVGVVSAATILVKFNVGAFLVLALVYSASTAHSRGQRPRRWVLLAHASFVALPLVVTAPLFGTGAFARFGIVVSLCFASVALWTTSCVMPLRRRHLRWAPIGATAAAIFVLMVAWIEGSTPQQLLHGILLDPPNQLRAFVFAPSTGAGDLLFVGAGLLAALGFRGIVMRLQQDRSRAAIVTSAAARVAVGVFIWHSLSLPVPPLGHAGTSFGYQLGLVWVALVPRLAAPENGESRFLRVVVCHIAVLQVLHAYPVAGSQVAFGTFLLVFVGGMCIADGVAEARSLVGSTESRRASTRAGLVTPLVILFLGVPALLTLDGARQQALRARTDYSKSVPLDLAGAGRLRVDDRQRKAYQAVVGELQVRHCKTFVTVPGLNSLYFFARKSPPTFLNSSTPLHLFGDALEQRMVVAVDGIRDLCVVRNRVLAHFWASHSRNDHVGPLERYIADKFVTVWRSDGFASFDVMVRRP